MLFCKGNRGKYNTLCLKQQVKPTSLPVGCKKTRSTLVLEQLMDSKVRKLGAFSANFGIRVLHRWTEFDLQRTEKALSLENSETPDAPALPARTRVNGANICSWI